MEWELIRRRFSRFNARIEFINAISKCKPQVFEDLHKKPLENYRDSGLLDLRPQRRAAFWRACYAGPDPRYYFDEPVAITSVEDHAVNAAGSALRIQMNVWQFLSDFGLDCDKEAHQERFFAERQPKILAWLASLEEWAASYSLYDRDSPQGWVIHWAFLKLDSYATRRDDDLCDNPTYRYFHIADIFGRGIQPAVSQRMLITDWNVDLRCEEFQLHVRGWLSLLQSEDEFRRRAKEDFEKELERYLYDQKLRLALEPEITLKKRRTVEGNKVRIKVQSEHYEWLARFQCDRNATITGIARSVNQSREIVRDVIHDRAEFIGLPLRDRSKGGRGKGSKDKRPRHRAEK